MAYTVKEKVETTSIPYAPKHCPCFEERKALRFTLDTLFPFISDKMDQQDKPYKLTISINGLKLVFYLTNITNSRMYYLSHTEGDKYSNIDYQI